MITKKLKNARKCKKMETFSACRKTSVFQAWTIFGVPKTRGF